MKLWAVVRIVGKDVSLVSIEPTTDRAQAVIAQLNPTTVSREKGAQYGQWEGVNLAIYRVDECVDAGWLYNGTKLENTRIATYTTRPVCTENPLDVAEIIADSQIETGRRVIDPLLACAIAARARFVRDVRVARCIARAATAELCAKAACEFVVGGQQLAPQPHLRVLVAKCAVDAFGAINTRTRETLTRALSKECTREVARRERSHRAIGKMCARECAAVGAARERGLRWMTKATDEIVDLYADYEELRDRAETREQYLERELECLRADLGDAKETIDNLMGVSYDDDALHCAQWVAPAPSEYCSPEWCDSKCILRTSNSWTDVVRAGVARTPDTY